MNYSLFVLLLIINYPLDSSSEAATDYFWAAMSEVKAVGDLSTLAYGKLAQLAKVLLVLPHSNVDPERLFSMVGKIETQAQSQLSPSTTCDLLTVQMNHDALCYESHDIVTDELVKAAKTATRQSLQHQSPSAAND